MYSRNKILQNTGKGIERKDQQEYNMLGEHKNAE
jgi:hypothetical protein